MGLDATDPFALRYYDKTRMVLGRTMEDWLRPAVAYWHSFVANGSDPFGAPTQVRPWFKGEPLPAALQKADAAFAFLERLGLPFFCFHDLDVAPEGATLRDSNELLDTVLERIEHHMQRTGIRLLWGTANLFSHPRYMAGTATNPDPEVFAYAAGQVVHVLNATHRLGGSNYVLWGGREGYDTLLNTDLAREDAQLGRFLNLVVEHKHRIGFKGTILIEPKPMEPTKHQYDRDVATVYGFSDQGSQYTFVAFGSRGKEAGVRPSMGSVGDADDNAMCRSFFATLACELLDRRRFRSQADARMPCFSFIEG